MNALLAPWFFRNVTSVNGGPIARMSQRQMIDAWGQPSFECYAYLSEEFQRREHNHYYGSCEGGGAAPTLLEARHRAISEAIERWCYLYITQKTPELSCEYGFDVEPSTTGMAAFPSLFTSSARRIALLEAIERWSVTHWWKGDLAASNLPAQKASLPFCGVELLTPFEHATVVILWRTSTHSTTAFGFAAADSVDAAVRKAAVELVRNERILASIPPEAGNLSGSLREQRLQWFSRSEGFQRFKDRMECSENAKMISSEKCSNLKI